MKRVCIVGASGKLGQYMLQHALDRGYEVVGVCREQSVHKLDKFRDRISLFPGATNDPQVIKKAVAGCEGVMVVLVPWGANHYSSGTAQAILDHAQSGARSYFPVAGISLEMVKMSTPGLFKEKRSLPVGLAGLPVW